MSKNRGGQGYPGNPPSVAPHVVSTGEIDPNTIGAPANADAGNGADRAYTDGAPQGPNVPGGQPLDASGNLAVPPAGTPDAGTTTSDAGDNGFPVHTAEPLDAIVPNGRAEDLAAKPAPPTPGDSLADESDDLPPLYKVVGGSLATTGHDGQRLDLAHDSVFRPRADLVERLKALGVIVEHEPDGDPDDAA